MNPKETNEIQERLDKVTPGRWKLWGMTVMADQDGTSNQETAVTVADTYYLNADGRPRVNDAEFIAHAQREDIPNLLAEVRRLRQGLWDVYGVLGGDTDGDPTPEALMSDIVPLVLDIATETRDEESWPAEMR